MRQGSPDEPPPEPSFRDPGPLIPAGAALVLAGGVAYGASKVAGFWHVALVMLAVLLVAIAVYLVGIFVLFVLFVRMINGFVRPRPEGLSDRWPLWVWICVPALVIGWALNAALSGFDASQWLWTGVSVVAGVVALLVIPWRRRRAPVPDRPDGPRHRGLAP
jgi:hypothetical protein